MIVSRSRAYCAAVRAARPGAADGCPRGTAPRRRRCCRRPRSCRWSSSSALIGAVPPPRERAQVLGGEALVERLEAEPRVEERLQRIGAEQQLAGAEAARVDERQAQPARPRRCSRDRSRAPCGPGSRRACAPARASGRRAPSPSCAGAGRGGRPRSRCHSRYLPRRPSRSTRAPSSASASSCGRQRPRPARVEHLDALASAGPPRAARAGGGSSRPREARASASAYERRCPAAGGIAGPSASAGPSRRRPPAGRRGESPERSPVAARRAISPVTASSGAYSRVWSVPGWAGSTP